MKYEIGNIWRMTITAFCGKGFGLTREQSTDSKNRGLHYSLCIQDWGTDDIKLSGYHWLAS